MQNLIPGVHVSSPAPLSFDQSIELRAFLLRRETGNLLIYSTASLATEVPTSRSSAASPDTIWAMSTRRPTATPRPPPPSGRRSSAMKTSAPRYRRRVRSQPPSPSATGSIKTSR